MGGSLRCFFCILRGWRRRRLLIGKGRKSVGRFQFLNAGRFISRGRGRHGARVIDNWELIYVISGTLEMFEGEREFCIAPGERLLLRPGIRHGGSAAYSPELSFFWGHCQPGNEEGGAFLASYEQYAPCARPERVAEYFNRILDEQRDGTAHEELDLLWEILMLAAAEKHGGECVTMTAPVRLAHRAADWIRLHFEESVSTADLAAELRCNPDYLGRVFRRTYGCSVIEALNRARIQHCCRLLAGSMMTVREAAFESGFNDPAYFRRCFFRIMAMTPGEYRRIHGNGHLNTE